MVGGTADGCIIAAGGANFPEALPCRGGKKVYSDRVFILANETWVEAEQRLPTPLAYSASVVTSEGVLVIGGETGKATSDRVCLLVPSGAGTVEIKDYPALPEPLAYTAGVMEGDYVYVVGGKNDTRSVNACYRLSLDEDKAKWEQLPDFPGSPRTLHAVAVQETKTFRELFVVVGRNQIAGQKSAALTTYTSYDLQQGEWREAAELAVAGKPVVSMGGALESIGSMHLLLYGGSDEVLFDELENLGLQLATTEAAADRATLLNRRDEILDNHPGFSRRILAFNTITRT